MKIGVIADWCMNYLSLNFGIGKWHPSHHGPTLENILQQIMTSRDVTQIRQLADDYRDAIVGIYSRGENQHMAHEKLMELTTCLEQHPIADEIYHHKVSA